MLKRLFFWLLGLGFTGAIVAVCAVLFALWHYGKDLPEYDQLANYEPPTVTRVHAGDGRLLAEFAVEKRVAVPIEAIPLRVVHAFISAEDKSFYQHPGIDIESIIGAALRNIQLVAAGRRPVGASTITQQVAKNFLLTNEVSIERKIKEAIIALRLEKAFSKDRILELYLNEIYLGQGSYGIAAAALNYFDKSMDELTIAEAAYLAALPKAPNNYHPIRKKEAAISRRNYVISQMLENGYITAEQADEASKADLVVKERSSAATATADYFVEEVRRELAGLYGDDALYKGGMSVRTTLDTRLQAFAEKALQEGLQAYDRRHGWRGPIGVFEEVPESDWDFAASLETVELPKGGLPSWGVAAVLSTNEEVAIVGLPDGTQGQIPMAELAWARPWLEGQRVGASPKSPAQVLERGQLVFIEPVSENEEGEAYPEGSYALRQIPEVSGGFVAMDPRTGRVLAMTGGFSFATSEFNRATQAKRQPGSSFKPFVYLTAFQNGFTPASIILDAPITIDQGEGLGKWKPANYSDKFYGPSTLRLGIEKSRNLMTVRLAQQVGMEKVAKTAEAFGIVDNLQETLAMALGSAETTVLRMVTAYSELANGGKKITPTLIDRIQNRRGETIYRHDQRPCDACSGVAWQGQSVPAPPDLRPQISDPQTVYQIVSLLQGAVQAGTGVRLKELGRPLAGKTGTTNESRDTWFMGFSPNLVAGVYVGFDTPTPLGNRETGSSVALPVFKSFMAKALEGEPITPYRIPPGLRFVWVNRATGERTEPGAEGAVLESFLPGTEPGSGYKPPLIAEPAAGEAAEGEGAAAPGAERPKPPAVGNVGGGGIY
ncbi:penicillin-binding protein 1A [Limibacillus halophilus]